MIQIFPFSFTSLYVAILVKFHLIKNKIYLRINLTQRFVPFKTHKLTIYFIIKKKFLKSDKLNFYLSDLRAHSDNAKIIIIGENIDYEELYKKHYHVFGIVDRTHKHSLNYLRKEIQFYLDGLLGTLKSR